MVRIFAAVVIAGEDCSMLFSSKFIQILIIDQVFIRSAIEEKVQEEALESWPYHRFVLATEY